MRIDSKFKALKAPKSWLQFMNDHAAIAVVLKLITSALLKTPVPRFERPSTLLHLAHSAITTRVP